MRSTPLAAATGLSKLFHDHSRVIIQVPLRILFVIVVALIARKLLHRAITRLTRPVQAGSVPGFLRRGRASNLLQSAGLLSERRAARAATISSVLKSFVSFVIFILAFLLVVGELGFDLAPFIAGTSIVGVALGFGAQNIVKDFLAGMFMIFEDQFGVGDVIDFEKASGTVEAVGLRTTKLRDVEGTVWYVRNGEVVRVGNQSQGYAQVVLDVPIARDADLGAASDAILAVAQEMHDDQEWHSVFLADPDLQGVQSLTREETVIRLVARVAPAQQWRTARELRRRVHDRLDSPAVGAPISAPPAPTDP